MRFGWRASMLCVVLALLALLCNMPRTRSAAIEWTPSLEFQLFGAQRERLAVDAPCRAVSVGGGWGKHFVCERAYEEPCAFYSFGIASDWSFDADLARRTGCQGFAFDPSVAHSTALAPNVTFMQVAARSLEADAWTIVTTLPALRRWLRHDRMAVLKMDCEGCEFGIAEDVENESPAFWSTVDQFAVEVHLPRFFMRTPRHMHNWALLLRQLRVAGLKLVHADITGCHPDHERSGCLPELVDAGYPCKVGQMCQNFAFAKSI